MGKNYDDFDDIGFDNDEFFPMDNSGSTNGKVGLGGYMLNLGKSATTALRGTLDAVGLSSVDRLIGEAGYFKDELVDNIKTGASKLKGTAVALTGGEKKPLKQQMAEWKKEIVTDFKKAITTGDFTFGANTPPSFDFDSDFEDVKSNIDTSTKEVLKANSTNTKTLIDTNIGMTRSNMKVNLKMHNASENSAMARHLQSVGYVANIDSNVDKIAKFVSTVGVDSFKASLEFSEKSLKMQQDMLTMMNDIKVNTKPAERNDAKKKNGLTSRLSDVFGYGFSGSEYAKSISSNFKNLIDSTPLGMIMGMGDLAGGMGGMGGKPTAGNWLAKTAFKAIPGLLLPSMAKDKLSKFNETLQMLPRTIHSKLSEIAETSDNKVVSELANLLVVKEVAGKNIKLGVDDIHEKASFDQNFYRVVTKGIPGLLAKILAHQTGQEEIVYNVAEDKFAKSSDIVREFKYEENRAYNSSGTLNGIFNQRVESKYGQFAEKTKMSVMDITKDFEILKKNMVRNTTPFSPKVLNNASYVRKVTSGMKNKELFDVFVREYLGGEIDAESGKPAGGFTESDQMDFIKGLNEAKINVDNFNVSGTKKYVENGGGGALMDYLHTENLQQLKAHIEGLKNRVNAEKQGSVRRLQLESELLNAEEVLELRSNVAVPSVKAYKHNDKSATSEDSVRGMDSQIGILSNIYELLLSGILVYPRDNIPKGLKDKISAYAKYKDVDVSGNEEIREREAAEKASELASRRRRIDRESRLFKNSSTAIIGTAIDRLTGNSGKEKREGFVSQTRSTLGSFVDKIVDKYMAAERDMYLGKDTVTSSSGQSVYDIQEEEREKRRQELTDNALNLSGIREYSTEKNDRYRNAFVRKKPPRTKMSDMSEEERMKLSNDEYIKQLAEDAKESVKSLLDSGYKVDSNVINDLVNLSIAEGIQKRELYLAENPIGPKEGFMDDVDLDSSSSVNKGLININTRNKKYKKGKGSTSIDASVSTTFKSIDTNIESIYRLLLNKDTRDKQVSEELKANDTTNKNKRGYNSKSNIAAIDSLRQSNEDNFGKLMETISSGNEALIKTMLSINVAGSGTEAITPQLLDKLMKLRKKGKGKLSDNTFVDGTLKILGTTMTTGASLTGNVLTGAGNLASGILGMLTKAMPGVAGGVSKVYGGVLGATGGILGGIGNTVKSGISGSDTTPKWNSEYPYKKNEKCQYRGVLYKSTARKGSNIGLQPNENPQVWETIGQVKGIKGIITKAAGGVSDAFGGIAKGYGGFFKNVLPAGGGALGGLMRGFGKGADAGGSILHSAGKRLSEFIKGKAADAGLPKFDSTDEALESEEDLTEKEALNKLLVEVRAIRVHTLKLKGNMFGGGGTIRTVLGGLAGSAASFVGGTMEGIGTVAHGIAEKRRGSLDKRITKAIKSGKLVINDSNEIELVDTNSENADTKRNTMRDKFNNFKDKLIKKIDDVKSNIKKRVSGQDIQDDAEKLQEDRANKTKEEKQEQKDRAQLNLLQKISAGIGRLGSKKHIKENAEANAEALENSEIGEKLGNIGGGDGGVLDKVEEYSEYGKKAALVGGAQVAAGAVGVAAAAGVGYAGYKVVKNAIIKGQLDKAAGMGEDGTINDKLASAGGVDGGSSYGYDGKELTKEQQAAKSTSIFKARGSTFKLAKLGLNMGLGGARLMHKGTKAISGVINAADGGMLKTVVGKPMQFILDLLDKLLKNPKIAKLTKHLISVDTIKSAVKNMIDPGAIMRMSKSGKLIKWFLKWAGPVGIVLSINDFLTGWNSANRYYELGKGAKVSFGMKLSAGIANWLSSVLMGLIPSDVIAKTIFKYLGGAEEAMYIAGFKEFMAKKAKLLDVEYRRLMEYETTNVWQRLFGSSKQNAKLLGFKSAEEFNEWRDKKYKPVEKIREEYSKVYGGDKVTGGIPRNDEDREKQKLFREAFLQAMAKFLGKLPKKQDITAKKETSEEVKKEEEAVKNEDSVNGNEILKPATDATIAKVTATAAGAGVAATTIPKPTGKPNLDATNSKPNTVEVKDVEKNAEVISDGTKKLDAIDKKLGITAAGAPVLAKKVSENAKANNVEVDTKDADSSKEVGKKLQGSPVVTANNNLTNAINTELGALLAIHNEQRRHNTIAERLLSILVDNSKASFDSDISRNEILAKILMGDRDLDGIDVDGGGKKKGLIGKAFEKLFGGGKESGGSYPQSNASDGSMGSPPKVGKVDETTEADVGGDAQLGVTSSGGANSSVQDTTEAISQYKSSNTGMLKSDTNNKDVYGYIVSSISGTNATHERYTETDIVYNGINIGKEITFIPKKDSSGNRVGDIFVVKRYKNGDVEYCINNSLNKSDKSLNVSGGRYGKGNSGTIFKTMGNNKPSDTNTRAAVETINAGGRTR